MNLDTLQQWFSAEQQSQYVSLLMGRVGLTRRRAECFVKLWVYLLLKQQKPPLKPPLKSLELLKGAVPCTHREAAALFYSETERGSDRSAGMMLDKLVALGLIKKQFDGNVTWIKIQALPELKINLETEKPVELKIDDFNPRCDAVPVANLLAKNYNWMNKNSNTVPYKIVKLLRTWVNQYAAGMRVLRRTDNLNPVGFYLLFPTFHESEINFFTAPSKSLHLSSTSDDDPFMMAKAGDKNCQAVFIRSWMIEPVYLEQYCIPFIQDVQQVLVKMQADFPNLCDLHTLCIHPFYEQLSLALGFQKTSQDPQLSVYWMYLALDRFLALNVQQALIDIKLIG